MEGAHEDIRAGPIMFFSGPLMYISCRSLTATIERMEKHKIVERKRREKTKELMTELQVASFPNLALTGLLAGLESY